MTEKTAQSVAQYTRHVTVKSHLRPYENKSPLTNKIVGAMRIEQLPEPGYWRLELELGVHATNGEELLCFEASSAIEAIVATQNLTDEEATAWLTQRMAGLLAANIRVALTNATQHSGYGPVILPPISTEQLLSFYIAQ